MDTPVDSVRFDTDCLVSLACGRTLRRFRGLGRFFSAIVVTAVFHIWHGFFHGSLAFHSPGRLGLRRFCCFRLRSFRHSRGLGCCAFLATIITVATEFRIWCCVFCCLFHLCFRGCFLHPEWFVIAVRDWIGDGTAFGQGGRWQGLGRFGTFGVAFASNEELFGANLRVVRGRFTDKNGNFARFHI